MSGRKLKKLNMAVAVAGILAAATACSSQGNSFTANDLLAGLNERGMEFEYEGYAGHPFDGVSGFVTGGEFRWGDESFWAYQFDGPGEALVAASRMWPAGDGMNYPTESNTWTHRVSEPLYPQYYYLRGDLIFFYSGRSEEVPDALDEILGQSFSGARAYQEREELGDDYPLFKSLWREYPALVRSATAEKFRSSHDNVTYRIYFEAYTVYSAACMGLTDDEWKVTGDEVHYRYVQRVVNLGVAPMTEPCDIEWEWVDRSFIAHSLTPGQTYKVLINGEQVTEFTAEGAEG